MRAADMTTHGVDDCHTLKVESRVSYRLGPVAKHWWLLRNDIPVAFLSTLTYTDGQQQGCDFRLCDIEVRDGYRQQGLVGTLVQAAERVEGLPIWTSGSFTPLGAKALGSLRVYPWETPGVKFDDMTFVKDWNTLHPRFLL